MQLRARPIAAAAALTVPVMTPARAPPESDENEDEGFKLLPIPRSNISARSYADARCSLRASIAQ